MSLIMCKCCKKEISANADMCPFCGEPMKYTEEQKKQAIKDTVEQQNEAKKQNQIANIVTFIIMAVIFIAAYAFMDKLFEDYFMQGAESLLEFIFDVDIVTM